MALYWAQELAKQEQDLELKTRFSKIAEDLNSNEGKITAELIDAQGKPMNIEGYYFPNEKLASEAMRPSPTLNEIIDKLR